jgi:hypothetical protein
VKKDLFVKNEGRAIHLTEKFGREVLREQSTNTVQSNKPRYRVSLAVSELRIEFLYRKVIDAGRGETVA